MKRIFETPSREHFFFGYYDKSPLSPSGLKLLACKATFIDRMPTAEDRLIIGYFDFPDGRIFRPLTETSAWNWQQGCMLQWLDASSDDKIIYNERKDGTFQTVVMELKTLKKTYYPIAYYTKNKNGSFALCIDNERHAWFRGGYSYQGILNEKKKLPFDPEDGIWHENLISGEVFKILNLADLVAYAPLSNMNGATHYVEHLMMSPDGQRFAFLHRWKTQDGGIYARLYTAATDGSQLTLLNDSGRMSHFCWRGDRELIGWGGIANPFSALRKHRRLIKLIIAPLLPFYHRFFRNLAKVRSVITGDSYILFQDRLLLKTRIAPQILTQDGHPSFRPGQDTIFVSDTYQQKDGYRELFIYDLTSGEKIVLDRLHSLASLDDSPLRCDLHPKWSFDGRFVCIDTTDRGYRSLYVYEV